MRTLSAARPAAHCPETTGALNHWQIVLRDGLRDAGPAYRSYVFDERSGSLVPQGREDFLLP